jgi:hypothetical protein
MAIPGGKQPFRQFSSRRFPRSKITGSAQNLNNILTTFWYSWVEIKYQPPDSLLQESIAGLVGGAYPSYRDQQW